MRKLHLNTEDLRVESFATRDAGSVPRGTVQAQQGTFSNAALASCGTNGCVGYSSESPVCVCDTTYTQRAPECDPSAETFCFDTRCIGA